MIGNFKEAFLNNQNQEPVKRMRAKNNVPRSVIRQLNKDLPDGFHYWLDPEEGHLVVKPTKAAEKDVRYTVRIDYKKNGIPEGLSQEKALDYIYRTQKVVKPSEAYTENNGKKLELIKIPEDPLTHEGKVAEDSLVIVPQPFPPAFPVELSVPDENGEMTVVTVHVRRQPFADMKRLLFANEDFPALKFQWTINEKRAGEGDAVGTITIHALPKEAETVTDAIKAMKIFRGFADSKLYMDGSCIKTEKKIEYNTEAFNSELSFLETLQQLEDIIHVKFNPGVEYSHADARLLYELDVSLIQNKVLKATAPYEQFHISEIPAANMSEKNLKDIFKEMEGKDHVTITFTQEVSLELMGASFNLFEAIMMNDMSVLNVAENKEEGGFDISINNDRSSNNPWTLFMQYAITEKEAQAVIEKHMKQRS